AAERVVPCSTRTGSLDSPRIRAVSGGKAMKYWKVAIGAVIAIALTPLAVLAADFPAPKDGSWIARDFKVHTGTGMPELRLAYTTVTDFHRLLLAGFTSACLIH